MLSAGLRSEAQEARLQMREAQKKMSELNAVSSNQVQVHCVSKKRTTWYIVHAFATYSPIFKILSLAHSVDNLQLSDL